jgi:hypothetical protein
MVKFSYEKIKGIFEEKGCKLLTTEKEFIDNNMDAKFSKYNIISSCGHERLNCRFKEFKSRNVGVLCSDCSNIEKIKKLKNNNGQKIERISIELLKKYVNNKFDIEIMNEATKVDIGIRLKENNNNLWFPIQLKACSKSKYTVFNFSMNRNNYDNMLIICISLEPVKFWLFNGNDNNVRDTDKISIGIKSKYNSNEVELENLEEKLIENIKLYPEYYKTLEELNIPLSKNIIKEREFIDYRIKNFPNINFIQADNNTSVDFTINSYKIQEKVGYFDNNSKVSVRFNLIKSGGCKTKKPYNINDNDYFWLNIPNKEQFLLIPSQILYDNGLLAKETENEEKRKTALQFCTNNIPEWLKEYIYEYKSETEKIIQEIFNNLPKIELEKEILDINSLLENNDIKTQTYLDSKHKAKEHLCIECNAIVKKYNAKRCVECNAKNTIIESRNNGRPSYLTLKEEMKTNTYQELGDKYGVSKPCVFLWIKKYEKHNLTDT